MAHIYRAPSENQQKVDKVLKPEIQRIWLEHEKRVKDSPRLVKTWIAVMIGCGVAALALVFWPGLLKGIQDAGEAVVDAMMDFFWGYEIPYEIQHMDFFPWIICFPVAALFGLFCALAGFLLMLINNIVPLVVTVLLFLVLIVIAGIAWSMKASIEDEVANFTYKDARDRAKNCLPEDLQVLQAGLEGEERALKIASALPDDTNIFVNLTVCHDGKYNETDMIVISPSGLTVVEVKNISGTIMGDLSDEHLTRRKFSKKGRAYDSKEDNPVKQVGGPSYRLANYLHDRGIDTEIRRCALFAHESVELRLTDRQGLSQKCPVLTWRDERAFREYLYSSRRYRLSAKRIEQITQELQKLM